MRDRVADQEWQAPADAEKSVVFGHHYRVLEFDGRDLLARGVGVVGHSELRQGAATTGRGYGTWSESGAFPEYSHRVGISGKLVHHGRTGATGELRSLLAAVEIKKNTGIMLTREEAADVFSRICRFSSADEVEVLFTGSRFALTRFANNAIHQNVEEENSIVSIRTNFAGRTARATTNQFDDESLRRTVTASEKLARVQVADPDLLPMPDAREALGRTGEAPVAPPSRFFEQTAAITPADRAEVVKGIVAVAAKHKLTTAGICSNSESREGIFNSRGLANWHHQTLAEISVTMLADDSSGWQKSNSPDVRNLDAAQLAETAAQKAVESAHPREIAPGKYTVILEPAAALDIVGFMFWDY